MKEPCAKTGHVWRVVFITGLCDSSAGGEQCVLHTVLHTECPVKLVNWRKVCIVLYCQRNSLACSNRMCRCIILKLAFMTFHFFFFFKLQLRWNPAIVTEERISYIVVSRGYVTGWVFPFFSSLSRCVYSPATTRTGESIHNRNFWPAFIAFCFLVWSLLCQESWLWLAGGQSVCKYLLIALDSAELFMHVVILCYSSTFNIWCIFLLSMTQQNCNQVHVPCKKESY